MDTPVLDPLSGLRDVPPGSEATKDLLFADLEYFGECEWRNEEVGEKRFNFFITLVTAIEGGLGALASQKITDANQMATIVAWANVGLLLFGMMTYLRMRHRDAVTDEYRETRKHIQETYRKIFNDADRLLVGYHVPVGLAELKWKEPWKRLSQGGYMYTTAVVNGVVLAVALVAFFGVDFDPSGKNPLVLTVWPGAIIGLALTAVLWRIPRRKVK